MRIFMIGTQRSGSNMLRLMLEQAPQITAPHPPHILERFEPLLPLYGDLLNEPNFMQLIDDVLAVIDANPVSWGVKFDRMQTRKLCRENSLVAVFGAVMDQLAAHQGRPNWLCKSLANVHFLPEIERYFGDSARYLYLYRDGRDVALSFFKAIVGEKTGYHVGKQWHEEQQLALKSASRFSTQFYSVSYEELTENPAESVERLCKWLQIEYSPSMLEFNESAEAKKTASAGAMWGNVVKPAFKNSNKWLKELSHKQIFDFESVAHDSLSTLGYQLHIVGKDNAVPHQFSAEDIATISAENKALKESTRGQALPEDILARRPQDDALALIRERLSRSVSLAKVPRFDASSMEEAKSTGPRKAVASNFLQNSLQVKKGGTFWFTGLSGAGKSTLANKVVAAIEHLVGEKGKCFILDGDVIRQGLNSDLRFSAEDRKENIRRIAEVSKLFAQSQQVCIVAFISPYQADRHFARSVHANAKVPFYECFINSSLDVCEQRDVKGLYKKARAGEIKNFTGISDPYEAPEAPDLTIRTDAETLEQSADTIIQKMLQDQILTAKDVPVIADSLLEASVSEDELRSFQALKFLDIDREHLEYLQTLEQGWAYPLTKFMDEEQLLEVIHTSTITDSHFQRHLFSVAITLHCTKDEMLALCGEKNVALRCSELSPDTSVYAVIEDVKFFANRKEEIAARVLGTTSPNHPKVARIFQQGDFLVTGSRMRFVKRVLFNDGLDGFRKTPSQIYDEYKSRGADALYAFQLRNPLHNGHILLLNETRDNLKKEGYNNPVLLLHPLGGWVKDDDVPLDVRMQQHQALLDDLTLDKRGTILAIWPSPMYYGGPAEVLWHVSSRFNCGITHLITGRDPAGCKHPDDPSKDCYDVWHGQKLLAKLAPMLKGVKICPFKVAALNKKTLQMEVLDGKSNPQDYDFVSGSKMRELARNHESPPPGFMSNEGWKVLARYYLDKEANVSPAKTVSVANFLSVGVSLAERCGDIIRSVRDSADLKGSAKNDAQDPVTIADLKVQRTIEHCLKSIFPGVKIVGEEDPASYSHLEPCVQPEQLSTDLITQDTLNKSHQTRRPYLEDLAKFHPDIEIDKTLDRFNIDDCTIWVDPLDGTSDFLAGNISAVTILIGLSVKGVSKLGIVHNVFSENDHAKSSTTFGSVEHGVFRVWYEEQHKADKIAYVNRPIEYIPPFGKAKVSPAEKFTVAASIMHLSTEMQNIIKLLDPVDIKRVGGAGNKCLSVATGSADAYIHPSRGLKNWDLCAPEVLIKAIGGLATDVRLQKLTYGVESLHISGLILAKSPELHSLITGRFGQFIEELQKKTA